MTECTLYEVFVELNEEYCFMDNNLTPMVTMRSVVIPFMNRVELSNLDLKSSSCSAHA